MISVFVTYVCLFACATKLLDWREKIMSLLDEAAAMLASEASSGYTFSLPDEPSWLCEASDEVCFDSELDIILSIFCLGFLFFKSSLFIA